MDSLKTLIVVAVLGAVSYAVYVSLNRNTDHRADLPVAPAWNGGNPGQAAAPLAGQTPKVNIPSPATLGEPAAAPAENDHPASLCAASNVAWAGTVSDTTTPVAFWSPTLVTVNV